MKKPPHPKRVYVRECDDFFHDLIAEYRHMQENRHPDDPHDDAWYDAAIMQAVVHRTAYNIMSDACSNILNLPRQVWVRVTGDDRISHAVKADLDRFGFKTTLITGGPPTIFVEIEGQPRIATP